MKINKLVKVSGFSSTFLMGKVTQSVLLVDGFNLNFSKDTKYFSIFLIFLQIFFLLRRMGSNHRPLGYEPSELPLLYSTICKRTSLIIYFVKIRRIIDTTKFIFKNVDNFFKLLNINHLWWRWRDSNPCLTK